MIESAKAKGIKAILLTPTGDLRSKMNRPDNPLNQHAEQFRALAKRHDTEKGTRLLQQNLWNGFQND